MGPNGIGYPTEQTVLLDFDGDTITLMVLFIWSSKTCRHAIIQTQQIHLKIIYLHGSLMKQLTLLLLQRFKAENTSSANTDNNNTNILGTKNII